MTEEKRNWQTKATAKYQAKIGLISKSYKLKKELVEEFADACKQNGESQASAISRMMYEYIEQTNNVL